VTAPASQKSPHDRIEQVSDHQTASPEVDDDPRRILRWFLVFCQATSIILTWPLWQARGGANGPPNLPISGLLELVQFNMGELLLVSLAVVLLWPRAGAVIHAGLLAVAILLDQLRIQPEFVSLGILIAGTIPRRGPLLLARSHLISLWLFAGLHKLLSRGYVWETGPELARGIFANLSDRQAFWLSIAMALAEVTLGVLAICSVSRRSVPVLAAILHGGILLSLVLQQWNTAVWPWNLALATCGLGFFAGWEGPLWPRAKSPDAAGLGWKIASAAVLAYPLLFYVNLCDGYLAWCVYSANVPDAVIYDEAAPDGERLFDRAYEPLNVPFTPSVRLFEQYFRRVAQPGDSLEIDDPRPLSKLLGNGTRWIEKTPQ
jgi:hypothetical protein